MLESSLTKEKNIEKIKSHKIYHFFKRLSDILISLLALLVLSPITLLLMLIIFIQDGHSPIYTQKRVGWHGKTFGMYKFRSMIYNADSVLKNDNKLYKKYINNGFKLPEGEDPRITKVGSFIRKTSLDEIPQFVNILKGQMSLVGPRPIVKEETYEYGDKLTKFLSVKPGALGLWQASGRSNIGYPERCNIELEYIDKASYCYDVSVFVTCCISILKKDGAF